jgi:phosphoglycolate phosphatase
VNKLIIFDCDGVLVDSELIIHKVIAQEMTKFGFPTTTEKAIQISSNFIKAKANNFKQYISEVLFKEYGKTIRDNDFDLIQKEIPKTLQFELQPIIGIPLVLEFLEQKNIAKCIASNAYLNEIIDSLVLVKIKSFFNNDRIFSASMVANGKPAPDLFLFAAKQMGFKPSDCLVIEDSTFGIKGALAANMQVIGFLGGEHTKYEWYKSNIRAYNIPIVSNSEELLNLLKQNVC